MFSKSNKIAIFVILPLLSFCSIIALGGYSQQDLDSLRGDPVSLLAEDAAIVYAKQQWNATLCNLNEAYYKTTGGGNFKLFYTSTVGEVKFQIFVTPWLDPSTKVKGEILTEEIIEKCPEQVEYGLITIQPEQKQQDAKEVPPI